MQPGDPTPRRWSEIELPDAWIDREQRGWRGAWRLLRHAWSAPHGRIALPDGLPLEVEIPRYARQEFHNLPNGNYSKRLAHGYSTGFDIAMLGRMRGARRRMAQALSGRRAVLDVGCGGGASTQALVAQGIGEVWGLDASPYMLRCADARVPQARFVQGLAEATGFPDARFDGASVCFVLHELPPAAGDAALRELARVLRPGGRLVLVEPAAAQYELGHAKLLWRHGWLAPYFRLLAHTVYEPFVASWHRRDVPASLAEHGFALRDDRAEVPTRTWIAERPA